MAVVHGIIKEHGGTIRIESSVGKGTTVFIVLPRCSPAETESMSPKPPELFVEGHGETVMVVEDNPEVRIMIETQLASAGFDVLTADDGEQALSILTGRAAQVQVVLLDIDLPGKDGLACLKEINVHFPETSVIMMSGLSSADPAKLATPFLRKPFSRTKLLSTIHSVLPADSKNKASGVLIVDDNEIVRKSTQALFVSEDYDVFLAENGAEAVSLLRENLDGIGTVLLDWNIPDTDPLSMLQELRGLSPKIRILVVSGDLSLQPQEIQAKGFSQLLRKPFSGSDLIKAVA
jgi:hypothetical protein